MIDNKSVRCGDLTAAFTLHYLGLLLLWDVELGHVASVAWLVEWYV